MCMVGLMVSFFPFSFFDDDGMFDMLDGKLDEFF